MHQLHCCCVLRPLTETAPLRLSPCAPAIQPLQEHSLSCHLSLLPSPASLSYHFGFHTPAHYSAFRAHTAPQALPPLHSPTGMYRKASVHSRCSALYCFAPQLLSLHAFFVLPARLPAWHVYPAVPPPLCHFPL